MGKREEDYKDEEVSVLAEKLLKDYISFRSELFRIEDTTVRFAYFVGFLNEWVRSKGLGFIVVTGGFAVELLTGRAYRTMDVDLITSNPRVSMVLEKFFEKISERIARGYLSTYEELAAKSIDIVATIYARQKPPLEIIINNKTIYVDPPEDLIVTYLSAWKYWNSTLDRDKALWLIIVLKDRLDFNYLKQRAREQDVLDKLNEIMKYV